MRKLATEFNITHTFQFSFVVYSFLFLLFDLYKPAAVFALFGLLFPLIVGGIRAFDKKRQDK